MPDKPGDPTEVVEDPVESKMAEIEKMREELTAEKAALVTDRQQTAELNNTIETLAKAVQTSNQPPEPDPMDDVPDEYDENTLRAAAALQKRGMDELARGMSAELADLKRGQFDTEWSRVKGEDPKNFGRMEAAMKQHFDKNTHLKVPGAVEQLFVQMRGTHYKTLMDMDQKERAAEPSVEPNSTTTLNSTSRSNQASDELNEDEWRVINGIRRYNTGREDPKENHPDTYFLSKYGRKPNFEEGYIEKQGYVQLEEK